MNSESKCTNKVKIGIGFVTGRKNFKNLIKTYVENWGEHGHRDNRKMELHAIVAYDLSYSGAKEEDFTQVKDDINEFIDSINFISENDCKETIKTLASNSVVSFNEASLVFGEGYGRKRNLILYWAIQNKLDYLLFLDDDEYPIMPVKIIGNKLTWIGQNVLGTHLKHIKNADITAGYHCGYISPIPYLNFEQGLSENDFKEFIEAISNEIVNWNSVKKKLKDGKGVTYGDLKVLLNPRHKEIKEEFGGKWIAGSNVCINLTNPDIIPPYYNPPGARGEDTFLSTCINDLKVLRVPCYTFHDGFLKYPQILSGVLPHNLKPILPYEEVVKRRFIKACLGWIRYKPLLMFITNKAIYKNQIEEMKEKLRNTIPILNNFFETDEFNQVINNLEIYDNNVLKHYNEYNLVMDCWYRIVTSRGFLEEIKSNPLLTKNENKNRFVV